MPRRLGERNGHGQKSEHNGQESTRISPGPVLEQLAVRLLDLQADLDDPVEKLANLLKVSLLEATGGHGWGAHTSSSGCHGAHISHHCILVQCDVTEVACLLQLIACQALHTAMIGSYWSQKIIADVAPSKGHFLLP